MGVLTVIFLGLQSGTTRMKNDSKEMLLQFFFSPLSLACQTDLNQTNNNATKLFCSLVLHFNWSIIIYLFSSSVSLSVTGMPYEVQTRSVESKFVAQYILWEWLHK